MKTNNKKNDEIKKDVVDLLTDGLFTELLNDDILSLSEDPLETSRMIKSRRYKRKTAERKMRFIKKTDDLTAVMTDIPKKNETFHYVSAGAWDFYTIIPVLIKLFEKPIEEMYISTWTMNRENAYDILENLDAGKIKKISLLTGVYFKRRETAVYSVLVHGLLKRGQRYIASENHTKIILIKNKNTFLTCEGSANLTANPRIEQYSITNDFGLYSFHKEWFEDLLNSEKNKQKQRELI